MMLIGTGRPCDHSDQPFLRIGRTKRGRSLRGGEQVIAFEFYQSTAYQPIALSAVNHNYVCGNAGQQDHISSNLLSCGVCVFGPNPKAIMLMQNHSIDQVKTIMELAAGRATRDSHVLG